MKTDSTIKQLEEAKANTTDPDKKKEIQAKLNALKENKIIQK